MKKRGITYACAKKLLLPLFMAVNFSLSAQINLSSQQNFSFHIQDKETARMLSKKYLAAPIQPEMINPVLYFSFPEIFIPREQYFFPGGIDERKNTITNKLNIPDVADISFRRTSFTYPECSKADIGISEYPVEQLMLYATVLKEYAIAEGYDTAYAFFVNMGVLSGKKRFFVVNLSSMQAEQSGLVSQGRGSGVSKYDKQYSNIVNSKCTSLGKYKITNKYKGFYGNSYRMTGLDTTNDNAYKRNIVLHSMGCIPDEENAAPACISEGCPAVSDNFLLSLSKIIDSSKKPVLLWVFDSNLEEVVIRKPKNYHSCSLHLHDKPALP